MPPSRPSPDLPDESGELYTETIELLHRARDGDAQSYSRLYERYFPRLTRWAAGRLPAHARSLLDTQDVVQEVLVRSLRRVEAFEPQWDRAFQSYLKRAVLNAVRDQIRRARDVVDIQGREDVVLEGPSPLDEAIGADNVRRYEDALLRVSPRDREAIVARLEMQCSYEELAEALGTPSPNAARMAVKRALLRLAEEMSRGEA